MENETDQSYVTKEELTEENKKYWETLSEEEKKQFTDWAKRYIEERYTFTNLP